MSVPILLFYGFSFIGILHSVIFSILAIKNKRTADLIITLFLLVQSIIILEYVFFWTGLDVQFHQLCNVSLTLMFLFGPLLFMYVDFAFTENKRISNYLFHFIPATIIFLFMLPYYVSTADLKLQHYKNIPYFIIDPRMVVYLIIAHMTIYFALILFKIIKEKRVGYIKNWLLIIVGLFGLYIVSYVSYYVLIRYPWFTLTTDYFVSISMCASIVTIIYMAYAKKKILDGYSVAESVNLENIYFSYKETNPEPPATKKKEQSLVFNYPSAVNKTIIEEVVLTDNNPGQIIPPPEITAVKYKNSGLTINAGNELAEALKQLMQKEKLYRECELKLETLAKKLRVEKHHVSQVINQHFHVNFFEYINLLRIDDAKLLLISSDGESMNIIEVAYAVGYNTKNTFNSAFRRIVGLTPTEYRNQYKLRMN